MKNRIKKGGKALKITICIIAALIIIFAGLFAAFFISEHKITLDNQNQTTGNQTANQSGQQNNTQNNQTPLDNCGFVLGTAKNITVPFRWHDMLWTGELEGNTTVIYKTQIDVVERNGLVTGKFILTQRNNPFTIQNISTNITKMPAKKAFISYDSSATKCPNTIIAGSELSTFMGILGIEAKGAVTNIKDASSPDQVKTCANADDNTTVFILKNGGCNPSITQAGNCVTIDAGKKCYIVETTERAIMDIIELGLRLDSIK